MHLNLSHVCPDSLVSYIVSHKNLFTICKFVGTKLILIGRHMIITPWVGDPLITWVTNHNWNDICNIQIFFYNYCITKITSFLSSFSFMFRTISHIVLFLIVIEHLLFILNFDLDQDQTFLPLFFFHILSLATKPLHKLFSPLPKTIFLTSLSFRRP